MVVVAPQDAAGRRFELTDELTLGRAAGCHIAVEDTYVSQVHARVFRRDGAFYVEDLGSTNGTLLDGRAVSGPALVEPGGRVQVGSTVLIPLGERAGLGLLAIASHDTERYLPTMSTDYLVRIGEIVTEAVSARPA